MRWAKIWLRCGEREDVFEFWRSLAGRLGFMTEGLR